MRAQMLNYYEQRQGAGLSDVAKSGCGAALRRRQGAARSATSAGRACPRAPAHEPRRAWRRGVR